MKKLYTVTLLLLSLPTLSIAQFLGTTQSADGKSTIPATGAQLSLDVAKANIGFSINNFNKVTSNFKPRLLWGLNVNAEAKEGTGTLFSKGDLSPASEGIIYFGLMFSNSKKLSRTAEAQARNIARDEFNQWMQKKKTEFHATLNTLSKMYKSELSPEDTSTLTTAVNKILKNDQVYVTAAIDDTYSKKLKNKLSKLNQFIKDQKTSFFDERLVFFKSLNNATQAYNKQTYTNLSIFPFGGINGISFKRFVKTDSANLANSFETIEDRGGKLGLMLNGQINNHWFGLSYGYVAGNNFSSLTKKDHTLRNTVSISPNQLISEKIIAAYSGKYGKVEWNELNIDYVTEIKLEKEEKSGVLINPYLRSILASRDTALVLNKLNIGTGFYFIDEKRKFIGGFYIELPDVNNNQEKRKPLEEQNLKSPFARLTFGIVAKFSFSALALFN